MNVLRHPCRHGTPRYAESYQPGIGNVIAVALPHQGGRNVASFATFNWTGLPEEEEARAKRPFSRPEPRKHPSRATT